MPYSKKNIIIIGAGPAAISMSATLQMANINHLILEKSNRPGGQLPEIHNELDDFIAGMNKNGHVLAQKVKNFIEKYHLPVKYNCKVNGIDTLNKTISYVHNNEMNDIEYDFAVIATGSRFKVEPLSINTGFDKDIYYRISYNLDDFLHKTVAVIGSGDNATIAALRLTDYASKIYLVNKSGNWKSRKDLVEGVLEHNKITVLNHKKIINLMGKDFLKAIELKDLKTGKSETVNIDKIVFKIGYLPNSDFISSGINLDQKGYIRIGKKYKTSADNVFAIGDIVSSAYKRISIAMGHGTDLGNYFLKKLL